MAIGIIDGLTCEAVGIADAWPCMAVGIVDGTGIWAPHGPNEVAGPLGFGLPGSLCGVKMSKAFGSWPLGLMRGTLLGCWLSSMNFSCCDVCMLRCTLLVSICCMSCVACTLRELRF